MDKGCGEFKAVFILPFFNFTSVINHIQVLEVAAKHKNLLILHPYQRVEHLLALLAKSGYDVEAAGHIPAKNAGLFIEPLPFIFSDLHTSLLLASQFQEIQSKLPVDEEELAVCSLAGDELLGSVSSESSLCKEKVVSNVWDSQAFATDEKSFECFSCKHAVKESKARIIYKTGMCACSISCFVNMKIKDKAPALHKLLTKSELAKKDPQLLMHVGPFGGLCFV